MTYAAKASQSNGNASVNVNTDRQATAEKQLQQQQHQLDEIREQRRESEELRDLLIQETKELKAVTDEILRLQQTKEHYLRIIETSQNKNKDVSETIEETIDVSNDLMETTETEQPAFSYVPTTQAQKRPLGATPKLSSRTGFQPTEVESSSEEKVAGRAAKIPAVSSTADSPVKVYDDFEIDASTFKTIPGHMKEEIYKTLKNLGREAQLPLFRKFNEALQEVIYKDEENQAKAMVFYDFVHQKVKENREKRERKRKQKASTPAPT
jgi:hypothetical protein